MKLDCFYPIVDSADWIERFVPLGIRLIQLRIKNSDKSTIEVAIARAKTLCSKYNCTLVINDYWESAINLQCNFVHLGQEDLEGADLNAIKRAGIHFGVSTHCEEELDKALSVNPNYIALGPIYPTTLKPMQWAPQGLNKISQWKKRMKEMPLVGIGGITIHQAVDVLNSGADSAAVVSDLIFNNNPENRVLEWLKVTQKWRQDAVCS